MKFRPYIQNRNILFPPRVDEDIADDDPVRVIDALIDGLDLREIKGLYKEMGRWPYHPQMMLKVIVYAYMNNIYSCRKIEKLLLRDVHFIWLSGYEKPDFVTINRFRNRVKGVINNVFTQIVLLLAERGFLSLETAYVDGTKIESKANKYTFVWRGTVEKNREKLLAKLKDLLSQVDDCIAQENSEKEEKKAEITPAMLNEIVNDLRKELSDQPAAKDGKEKKAREKKEKQINQIEKGIEKLADYDQKLETLGERNSYSKTDSDATFMRMKEDAMNNGQTKPGYNLQIATNGQFITHFDLFPKPNDTTTLIPFSHSYCERYGQLPSILVADAGYGSEENYRFLSENGVEAYVKYNYFHKETRPKYQADPFSAEGMYYNPKDDYYVCPMGQHLELTKTRKSKTSNGYETETAVYRAKRCESCPLRALCYKGNKDRKEIEVNKRLNEYKKEARDRLLSPQGVRYRGQRCIEPEAVFGQMKYDRGYKRFRHFGKDKVTMDFAFFAIASNLNKMISMLQKSGKTAPNTPNSPENGAITGHILPFSPLAVHFPGFSLPLAA